MSGNQRGRGGGPIGLVVRGIASGIGFASESISHHKEKKRLEKQDSTEVAPDNSAAEEMEQHEEALRDVDEGTWQLDEAQDHLTELNPTLQPLADSFILNHPPPTYSEDSTCPEKLALPVVLTQRRPKTRARGFVRAYPPILETCGIDQTTFLDFVDKLNKAVEPNPWIQAINLASLAASGVPEPFTLIIARAVQVATKIASEMHSRSKTNTFLDKINAEFFRPRGLIALVMTWAPQSDQFSKFVQLKHNLSASNATPYFEFPECAPLIFPALDQLAVAEDTAESTKKKTAVKRAGAFAETYMDRRAIAKWYGEHPDSVMANAQPKVEFKSRYADPNTRAASGDPLALLTGGRLYQPGAGGLGDYFWLAQKVSDGLSGSRNAGRGGNHRGYSDGYDNGIGSGGSGGRGLGGGLGRQQAGFGGGTRAGFGGEIGGVGPLSSLTGVRKLMNQDVLYLLIVNMPTAEEIAHANDAHAQTELQGC